jgi:murein DD-endopeptidase MepM/ murein hydrolase activator NlpD
MAAPAIAAGAAAGGKTAGASGAAGGSGAGMSPGAQGGMHLPSGGGGNQDDEEEGGGGGAGLLLGLVAAFLSVIVLIIAPVAVITQQNVCATEPAISSGVADPPDLGTIEIATRIYEVGEDMRVAERFHLAAFATGLVESGGGQEMRNLPPELSDNDANPNKPSPGHVTSVGVFQQQDFLPWTKNGRNRMSVKDAARTFYEEAKRLDRPGYTIGQLAQDVQNSAYASKYDPAVPRAREILAQVKARAGNGTGGDRLSTVRLTNFVTSHVLAAKTPNADDADDDTDDAASDLTLQWPVASKQINSPFGPRTSPCAGCSNNHEGVDLQAPDGEPIHAAAAGQIVFKGQMSGYGNYLCIRHRANFATCYAHQSRFADQPQGSMVNKGEVIGYVGSTGVGTGPHLHFEVRTSGGPADPAVDPAPYLRGAAAPGSEDSAIAGPNCGGEAGGGGVPDGEAPTTSGPKATLNDKVASAPASAPAEVKKMIAAGNALQDLPYTYGGGHDAKWTPNPGFDCSATVTYALWKAGLVNAPMVSGDLARWGEPGKGRWVTIYSNAEHTFAYIAGMRLDTSPQSGDANSERGPRWRGTHLRNLSGFTATHPPGL